MYSRKLPAPVVPRTAWLPKGHAYEPRKTDRWNTRHTARTLLPFAALVALLLVLSGCGVSDALDRLTGQVGNTTTKTTNILDDAINALNKNSADWQQILKDTRDKLTDSVQSTVRTEVSQALDRAVATTSGEFRCDVDFLRSRVREDLVRIKAEFLHQTVPALQPALCDVIPLAVDLNLDPSRRNLVEFYGYNFDTRPDVQLFLENSDGTTADDTAQLAKPTYYHMTANLGGSGVQFTGKSQKLHLRWQDEELSTISILQPTTPVCQSQSIDPVPTKLTIIPDHDVGDTNFGGNGPRVSVNVTVDRWFASTGVGVSAVIRAEFSETGGDHTHASKFSVTSLYTPQPGWYVDQLTIGQHTSNWTYLHSDTKSDIDSFDLGGEGPVQHLDFESLNSGDVAGSQGRVTITFNPLRMVVTQQGNCVSPITATHEGLKGRLSPGTVDRLRPALQNASPEIIKVPPAFSK